MEYEGQVRNGVVVLEGGKTLPEGTRVRVEPVDRASGGEDEAAPTLFERLKPIIGIATGLPPDASRNIDRDLYETPHQ